MKLKFKLPLRLEIRSCKIGSVLKNGLEFSRRLGLAGGLASGKSHSHEYSGWYYQYAKMVCINILKVVCMQFRVLLAKPRSTICTRHSSVNRFPQNSKILTPPFLPIHRLLHTNGRIWQRFGSLSSPLS